MKKTHFVVNHIYHIYNRGVEERKTFLEDGDYFRFIHDLFEFNDVKPALNLYYKLPLLQSYEVQPRKIRKRELLVEILAFCLMPNHYHLMLREIRKNGIIKFTQKLGTGYTMYFNKKCQRKGPLFSGRCKAVEVSKETHFIHLPYYIHFNPLDLIEPGWRLGNIRNFQKAINFLESYRWSSHLDYLGNKNFPSIIREELLNKILGGPEDYKTLIKKWLQEMNWAEIKPISLE